MSKRVRYAGAQVTFFFVTEDDDGDVETIPTQPLVVKSKDWRANWTSPGATEVIEAAMVQLSE